MVVITRRTTRMVATAKVKRPVQKDIVMALQREVTEETFQALHTIDIDRVSSLTEASLRPVLPCLVRMSLCAPLDASQQWTRGRKKVLKCLSGVEVVNSLVGLLSIDFHELEQDARKEQQLRLKLGNRQTESILISQLEHSVALEFEKTDAARKLRLLLSELLFIISQIQEPQPEFYMKSSELFESEVYLEEVADVLCIAQAELPMLLPVCEVAEALLHVKTGPWLLTRMVVNAPDSFRQVCCELVKLGEKQDEDSPGGQARGRALSALCKMCPVQALTVRDLCVSECRLPALAVHLTLQYGDPTDVVGFVSGLLLGSQTQARAWFAQYIRNGQKRKDSDCSLVRLRGHLLSRLQSLLPVDGFTPIAERDVVQACAFIRLYCAMKGIAALRFNDEESRCLLRLLTSQPPRSEAGGRFVSLGLCMLLACPYLPSNHEQERRLADWLKWLVAEAGNFEQEVGSKASFGEMLLLIAIHFHSNQNNAIGDLVSSTLGIKSAVKANALSKIKQMFVNEIFTEQVVASHAVKVSVTPGLNADMSGHLPVHCVYQLLKSRVFSKHRVAIKDWIYHQLRTCTTPIHPVLPNLIEVYITSVVLPSNKSDRTNEPLTEKEILAVFRDKVADPSQRTRAGDTDRMRGLTAQVLVLYYLLLYQDTLHNNMKSVASSGRTVHQYSPQLWAQLPLKYLLQQAQRHHQLYAGLFSPLLRLLATHYTHLCLVEDWLDEELSSHQYLTDLVRAKPGCSMKCLQQSFHTLPHSSPELQLYLDQLCCVPEEQLLPYADVLVPNLRFLLKPGVPGRVLDLVKKLWVRLNTLMPRRLRVMTVNALCDLSSGPSVYTEEELTTDPLLVLSCDSTVLQCPPLLEVMIRVLDGFLQASQAQLHAHTAQLSSIQEAGAEKLKEQEQLRDALLATQNSATLQLLLELCLPGAEQTNSSGLLSPLREIQGIVCSYLHQKFIADPALIKLVHFQGYPSELLPVTVAGIPSMHICLDFIPELLSQQQTEKQVFAIDLVSHLSLQYPLPKSLEVGKLAVSVMATLLNVLPGDLRTEFFLRTLPSVARISQAFPPLCEDVVELLVQLGKVCTAHLANTGELQEASVYDLQMLPLKGGGGPPPHLPSTSAHSRLYNQVKLTYSTVVRGTLLLKD